jgi:hypothetical protein
LALTLLTLAITIGPILGTLLVYSSDLAGLVVPDKITQIMSGLGDINPENIIEQGPAGTPDVQYNTSSKTFTASFPFKNPFPFDTTIDSVSGPMECDEHHFALGSVSLKSPITMKAGGTATAIVQGTWTDEAVSHFQAAHQGEESIKISLSEATIKAGSMTMKYNQPMSIGEIPLT